MNTDHQPDAQSIRDYERVEAAIRFLVDNRESQPELAGLAEAVGVSPYHLQRLFTRWAGVSPKKFLQHLTIADAKRRLDASASVLDAALDAGLSGPGRLHDLFIGLDAVTPGEYKSHGQGLVFTYGFQPSPFGMCMLVVCRGRLSGLSFVIDGDLDAGLADQAGGWEAAEWRRDDAAVAVLCDRIFGPTAGDQEPLNLLMRGTPFQIKVWQALIRIPPGAVTTYGRIADEVCTRRAARAVGTACGSNRIGYLIPCHRVIRDTGAITGYRWGRERKLAMLAVEAERSAF